MHSMESFYFTLTTTHNENSLILNNPGGTYVSRGFRIQDYSSNNTIKITALHISKLDGGIELELGGSSNNNTIQSNTSIIMTVGIMLGRQQQQQYKI